MRAKHVLVASRGGMTLCFSAGKALSCLSVHGVSSAALVQLAQQVVLGHEGQRIPRADSNRRRLVADVCHNHADKLPCLMPCLYSAAHTTGARMVQTRSMRRSTVLVAASV